jgi:predicted flap endonuclease-1-like 5' DNA nuclease
MATHQHAAKTAGTPAGSVAAPTFTGAEMSTHQHAAKTAGTPAGTNSAPAFTGNEVATHAEAGNADNLSALTGVRWVAWGY